MINFVILNFTSNSLKGFIILCRFVNRKNSILNCAFDLLYSEVRTININNRKLGKVVWQKKMLMQEAPKMDL